MLTDIVEYVDARICRDIGIGTGNRDPRGAAINVIQEETSISGLTMLSSTSCEPRISA